MAEKRRYSISSLPDEILQLILSSLPTRFAIRTSALSKRWRHVWSDTPSLSFDLRTVDPASINDTLTLVRYTARKMMTFQLCNIKVKNLPVIDRWIEFAMSRNVENMLMDFYVYEHYGVQIWFFEIMIPSCSWASLKNLSLRFCKIPDESLAKVLSGCPFLETLTLYRCCVKLGLLDLSKSLRLRTLEIHENMDLTQIVAPHLHCLRLTLYKFECTLVDVSSLTEAKLDIKPCSTKSPDDDDFVQVIVKMLEKLQNVDKLTFGANFLKILSLPELRRVPFPMFNVKALTFETMIIHGIVKVLQSSPELKKLTVDTQDHGTIKKKENLDYYMDLHGLNSSHCWSSKARAGFGNSLRWSGATLFVASFMEAMLNNTTKTLEKMVVRLECSGCFDKRGFEELLEMVPMLSNNNNVSIVFSSIRRNQRVDENFSIFF